MPPCSQIEYTRRSSGGQLSRCWSVSHLRWRRVPRFLWTRCCATSRLRFQPTSEHDFEKNHKISSCDYCDLQYKTTSRKRTESYFVYCQVANSNLMKTMNGKETTSTTIINNRPVTIKTFKLEPGMTLQNIPLPPGTLVEPSAKVCTKCPHLDLLDSKSVQPMYSRL